VGQVVRLPKTNFYLKDHVYGHDLIDTRTVNNEGTLTLTDTAALRFYSGSPTFNNQATGKFIVDDSSVSTALIEAWAAPNATFNNRGTFTKKSYIDSNIILNLSIIPAHSLWWGLAYCFLEAGGNSVHTGTFNVSANATLEFSYGHE